jgi:hypothetical protein
MVESVAAVVLLVWTTSSLFGSVPAASLTTPARARVTAHAARAAQDAARPAASGRVTVTATIDSLRIPSVTVALRDLDRNVRVAQTTTDATGQATFPDVPPGRYSVHASRDGFVELDSPAFRVEAGETKQVLFEMQLTLIRENVDVVVPAPTGSMQPVAVSDVLSGTKMDVQPLAGDDFQSLLTLLPSVIRGPDGRLRLKGGSPTTGALQVSSASLNDPSTGDFDLELPSGAVESVEVLSNPFAAEYGRFSTSVTQVRTKRGTDEWTFKPGNLIPGFGKGFGFVNRFEPRLSLSGPIRRGKLLFGEYLQYRFLRTPVKSLPGDPQLGVDSFDSFTRVDAELSPRHALTVGVFYFPRSIKNATLSTFRPPETTPKFRQSGFGTGVADRLIVSNRAVLESTFAIRRFQVEQETKGARPMVYAPASQSGDFFSAQERHVNSLQFVEALTVSKDHWAGEHVFKVGIDFQHSHYDGDSYSQPVEIRRLDGSLAELITFAPPLTHPDVSGTEFAVFAQDRWRVNERLMFELGMRSDRDDVVQRVNYSPRAGVAIGVLPEGRAILRAGIGKFAERTPLTVGGFQTYEQPTIVRFGADGHPLTNPVTLVHTVGSLRTPESIVQTMAWDHRVGRRFFFKAAYLHRSGSHAHILSPDPASGVLALTSTGESKYWEVETTGRYLASEHRDLTVSYVRSHGTRDLNDFDQFFGNFREPIVRPNEYSLAPTDVPNRIIVRGSLGLPGKWVWAPVFEWRTGFPWSAVDEFLDYVGPANEAGRLPSVKSLDFTLARPWRFGKLRFTGGLKVYNVFNSGNERDVQTNITSPDYGQFYNPIERSIGFVLSATKP